MPYLDRLRDCAYRDPNGTTHQLLFDDVSRDGAKKAATFDPPQQDRTEVQDMGNSGVRFSLSVYITGDDYDQAADAFWAGLSLRHTDDNPGTLAHPRWGDVTVKPLTFSQSESFVDGMGRSTFAIEFVTVDVTAKFPAVAVNQGFAIQAAADDGASSFIAGFIGPDTARSIAIVADQATNTLASIRNRLAYAAAVTDDLASEFDSAITQATDTIGALVDTPAAMAEALVSIMRMPATAVTSIKQKLDAYAFLFDDLASSFTSGAPTDLETLSLTLSASALAASEAATAGDLANRAEAVACSDSIAALLAYYRSMMDLTGPDGDMVARTVDLLSLAQAHLLEASFELKSERRAILDADTDPISETFKRYGTVDMLDQFCKDNALADGEFYSLSIGREVVWYA
jgi:prophage DNA circulation protein